MLKKTTQFRSLLTSSETEFIMEAHNGLTARIAEEAGFKGIWGSGLSISAALGVRDNNEASWTQVLEVLEFMSDATSVPILLDGDTGYGNFNNMRRLVQKLEQRGVAAVCIEDKLFPKTNSFISGETQPLADIDEFCGKIKAGKDAQTDSDFSIVARVEAFIAGWGLDEVLKRAEAYRLAGADAILIHSKKSTPADIEAFMKEWGNRHPVVIVPTKYYSTPTDRFRELNISLVIWANHAMRASVKAVQDVTRRIYAEQSLLNVEDKIVSVSEVFRLQGEDELRDAEKKYLPKSGCRTRSIILAATRGDELGAVTATKPKAMIEVEGKPILLQLVDNLNELGVKDCTVVRGYGKDHVKAPNIRTVDNDDHASTTDLYSLYLARTDLVDSCIVAYGDTLFRKHLISDIMQTVHDFAIVVDADMPVASKPRDFVTCSRPYRNDFFNADITLVDISFADAREGAHGIWTGLLYCSAQGSLRLQALLEAKAAAGLIRTLTLTALINELATAEPVGVIYTKGGWLGVDQLQDLEKAGTFYA